MPLPAWTDYAIQDGAMLLCQLCQNPTNRIKQMKAH